MHYASACLFKAHLPKSQSAPIGQLSKAWADTTHCVTASGLQLRSVITFSHPQPMTVQFWHYNHMKVLTACFNVQFQSMGRVLFSVDWHFYSIYVPPGPPLRLNKWISLYTIWDLWKNDKLMKNIASLQIKPVVSSIFGLWAHLG